LIFEAIKKILEGEKKGEWVEVMPKVVWSHNTAVVEPPILRCLGCYLERRQCYPKKSNIKVYVQQRKHHHAPLKPKRKICWSQAQEGNQFVEVLRRDKVLEGPEGQEKRIPWQLSPLAKPSDGELWQARIKMGWDIHHRRKDEARGLSPCGSTRIKVGALVEHRQSPSYLCLTFCKN
jgi:hypothetical protein